MFVPQRTVCMQSTTSFNLIYHDQGHVRPCFFKGFLHNIFKKINKSENISIPGVVPILWVYLLKDVLNSSRPFWLESEVVQGTQKVKSYMTLGPLAVETLPL